MHSFLVDQLLNPPLVILDMRIRQIRCCLLDWNINVGRQVLVDFSNDLLQIVISIVLFDRLEHFGDEQEIRNELWRR